MNRMMSLYALGMGLGLVLWLVAPVGMAPARAAFVAAPTNWIAGWSVSDGTCSVPVAAFATLTAGQADGATGDVRNVVYSFLDAIYDAYTAAESTNRPATMQVLRSAAFQTDGSVIYSYVVHFTMEATVGLGTE